MALKITDAEFNRLVKFMHSTYGIDLSKKRILIEGRLSNTLAEKGFTNYNQYMDSIFADKSGRETVELINKLTTNHTYFMREPQHFEFMKQVFLPYIEKTVKDRDVRIWCAASSSGEEPYTIAMVIDDYFGQRRAGWDLRILATDISTRVLDKAKKATYPAEALESLPADWKRKYFTANADGTYTVVDRIRKEVIYKQFNLMDKIVYKKPYDLISCRNVMIYFDAPTKDALVERFYDVSKQGAYLFIGHAESVSKKSRYNFVQPAIYQKK
ncbi:MAG: protein-glutamate O-methyltransferase CheR [Clostridium sp.]|nr:protein-glutamate O-methyltransferase CheR [Clostridium sp.]MCM1547130.1 protein-glutamate O-methyltransferase CheR [Ruminococcus sp.]